MRLTSPSARFFSNSRCFASASAMRLSMAANDSRVKGRNKLRSSSDIESRSSVIVYMANNESLRFPRPVGGEREGDKWKWLVSMMFIGKNSSLHNMLQILRVMTNRLSITVNICYPLGSFQVRCSLIG